MCMEFLVLIYLTFQVGMFPSNFVEEIDSTNEMNKSIYNLQPRTKEVNGNPQGIEGLLYLYILNTVLEQSHFKVYSMFLQCSLISYYY